jgi:hypothetical protein
MLCYIGTDGTPVKRFVKFIAVEGRDAETLTSIILSTLNDLEIYISNCRGQCYDSASNMAGKYSGVQQRLKYILPFAHFVPCSARSLNIVSSCAAESCVNAVSFFWIHSSTLQYLFAIDQPMEGAHTFAAWCCS